MTRLPLAENDLGLTEALGPLVIDNAQEAADACGGAIVPSGVSFLLNGGSVTAPWGTYLVTNGLQWGIAAHWWVEDHLT
jgi:hypothetical protein